ncbi:MAG: PepSY-associated TM helix domain-containing protein [Pseudomonadota bacterium]
MTKQRFYALMRTIHLYSSTALFASLLFFCVTGFTLSHGWYLDDSASSESIELDIPTHLADSLEYDSWDPDLDALQSLVETHTDLRSPQNIQLDRDYGEVTLSYSAPAGDAEVIASLDGIYIDIQKGSWLAVLNDLHKNRDAGNVWSLLIDVTAIGMLLFAFTGLIIVFQNRRKRSSSLWVISLGLATPIIIFLAFVPAVG